MNNKIRATSLLLGLIIIFSTGLEVVASVQVVTVEDAIEHGVANSHILDKVKTEIDLAKVAKRRGAYAANKLKNSEKSLKEASSQISNMMNSISGIPEGTPQAAEAQARVEAALQQVERGEQSLQGALKDAAVKIKDNLDFDSLDFLSLGSSAEIIELMSSVLHEVTEGSYDYYENNIALLIKNSYCEALKKDKIMESKKDNMERALAQYKEVEGYFQADKASQEELALAGAHYKSTKIEYEKALGEAKNAKVELKKNANMDMGLDIELVDIMVKEPEEFDLNEGIAKGLVSRFEIKKALGDVLVKRTNFDETKKSYTPNTFQYKEAKHLLERARVELRQARIEVESSIRQDYNLVTSTAKMLKETEGMREAALANLEKARSVDQDMEKIILAEDNLSKIEETIGEITYGYNLARIKYKNSIGDYIY